MRASFETHCGTIRVHSSDEGKFGDPYEWSCTATFTPDGEAWLGGTVETITPSIWKAVHGLLREHGLKVVVWQRRKPGEPIRTIKGSIEKGARIFED